MGTQGVVTVGGVRMTVAAAANVQEAGVDIYDDVIRLRTGRVPPAELLRQCLDGADEDREAGWRDYVAAIEAAAVELGVGLVVLEEMPGWARARHRAAGNWGAYPRNGAHRRLCDPDEAAEAVATDADGYAHVVGLVDVLARPVDGVRL